MASTLNDVYHELQCLLDDIMDKPVAQILCRLLTKQLYSNHICMSADFPKFSGG